MNVTAVSMNSKGVIPQVSNNKGLKDKHASITNNSTDSFSREKSNISFKGKEHVVEATAGTAAAGIGGLAAGGLITVAAAPVVVPALIIAGTAVALHGIFKAIFD